ncbi:hypothetical protein SELSPUOL_00098 [Selenomonas sputigena ATCC 35185]|uniref:Uncharacterized protein n=1 Tax=Selenomonas sputigena (strain ATCC 35185 / DSM 20758 / CCUG 44933 / VPI D19B-28) TaxID=546271 RepID=C9LRN1_SELS3|nr:hypothetical protein SELSPUOL_00098 [Selenomonas sputigena ATCC 35185]
MSASLLSTPENCRFCLNITGKKRQDLQDYNNMALYPHRNRGQFQRFL